MDKIPNIAPREILREEFLLPMGISAYKLAKDTNMPATRISEILKGRRRITADTALRLSATRHRSPPAKPIGNLRTLFFWGIVFQIRQVSADSFPWPTHYM